MITTSNLQKDLPTLLADGRERLETDPARAAELARRALALAPHSADAHRLLGAALRRLGQNAAANDAELAAIYESDNDPELAAAGEAMMRDDYMTAEPILRDVLQRRPDDVAAIRMLAEIAANFGALRDAERLLRRALDLAPGFEYAPLYLALALNQQNRAGEALAELEKIHGELRDFEDARNLRASLLGRVGDYERSAQLYQRSANEAPQNLKLLISLGYAQQTLGRTDEAVATYRRTIEQRSSFGEAWWSLANLKTFRFTDQDIASMEGALDIPALEDEDRLHLHFALGKAFEDRGEDERAFQYYQWGNAIRAGQLRYEPAQATALVDKSERVFTTELLRSRATAGCAAPDPIFIIGMPRAGSTLIEQILASHPLV